MKDAKIYDGAGWQSLKGPPGPSAVSADAGNIAELGSDGLVLVQNPNDLRPTHILAGTSLAIGSTVRGIVYDGTQQNEVVITYEQDLPTGHTIWISGGSYADRPDAFLEITPGKDCVVQFSLPDEPVSFIWYPIANYEEYQNSNAQGLYDFAAEHGQGDGAPINRPDDPDDPEGLPPSTLDNPPRIRIAKGIGYVRLLKRLPGLWDVIGRVEVLPSTAAKFAGNKSGRSITPPPPTVSGFLKYLKT